ncbi:MAG: hypothetical protein JXL20_05750 [Deltaproteobacteria bacterium]|nr:hypothetical protein [Deltaproteobacteria bacterium]
MTHSDAGHYSAKHAPGENPDERIAEAIRGKAKNVELACAEAERLSAALGVPLAEIGRTLDLLEFRIVRCQLGLFGYPAGKARPRAAAAAVAPELEAAIRNHLADGRLPCKAAWEIAAEHKIARIKISSACETLMIRIKPCQLGAF